MSKLGFLSEVGDSQIGKVSRKRGVAHSVRSLPPDCRIAPVVLVLTGMLALIGERELVEIAAPVPWLEYTANGEDFNQHTSFVLGGFERACECFLESAHRCFGLHGTRRLD